MRSILNLGRTRKSNAFSMLNHKLNRSNSGALLLTERFTHNLYLPTPSTMSRPTTPLTTTSPQPSPLRSSTAPIKKHHHHHHIPHHPHRHHHRDKSIPQSAILPSSTSSAFDSLLSPLTKATSRTEGAPDLSTLLREEREARARERAEVKAQEDARKRGWEEVRRGRERRRVGEELVCLPQITYFLRPARDRDLVRWISSLLLNTIVDYELQIGIYERHSTPCPILLLQPPAVLTTPTTASSPPCPSSPQPLPPSLPSLQLRTRSCTPSALNPQISTAI